MCAVLLLTHLLPLTETFYIPPISPLFFLKLQNIHLYTYSTYTQIFYLFSVLWYIIVCVKCVYVCVFQVFPYLHATPVF